MLDIDDLYQDLILDHNKRPRNRRRIEHPDHVAEGYNPLCGDRVTVYANVKDGIVEDVSFEGQGCAISTASASLMTDVLKGKSTAEARRLFERFHGLVTGEQSTGGASQEIGKLEAFSGVSKYPVRVKCATLAWHTLNAALTDSKEPVSTE